MSSPKANAQNFAATEQTLANSKSEQNTWNNQWCSITISEFWRRFFRHKWPLCLELEWHPNHGAFHQLTWHCIQIEIMVSFTSQHDIAVKLCLSPANTIGHCSQTEIMVSFTSQCSMTLQSNWNHGVFHQSKQHDIAVKLKSWCLSPASTSWHCSQTEIIVSFTSQRRMAWQSD